MHGNALEEGELPNDDLPILNDLAMSNLLNSALKFLQDSTTILLYPNANLSCLTTTLLLLNSL